MTWEQNPERLKATRVESETRRNKIATLFWHHFSAALILAAATESHDRSRAAGMNKKDLFAHAVCSAATSRQTTPKFQFVVYSPLMTVGIPEFSLWNAACCQRCWEKDRRSRRSQTLVFSTLTASTLTASTLG